MELVTTKLADAPAGIRGLALNRESLTLGESKHLCRQWFRGEPRRAPVQPPAADSTAVGRALVISFRERGCARMSDPRSVRSGPALKLQSEHERKGPADADRRRAADAQTSDRLDCVRDRAELADDQPLREQRLVDDLDRVAAPGDRRPISHCSRNLRSVSMTSLSIESAGASVISQCPMHSWARQAASRDAAGNVSQSETCA